MLKYYFQYWKDSDSKENFFLWLDEGEGKNLDLKDCPRKDLEASLVKYLTPAEREDYIVTVNNGLMYYQKRSQSSSLSSRWKK